MQESGDGSGHDGQETFGSVPGQGGGSGSGSETFGTVPSHGSETFGTTSHPQSSTPSGPAAPAATGGNRNVGLLVGGVIAVLVVIAAIVGIAMK